jgi:uncharacterized protein
MRDQDPGSAAAAAPSFAPVTPRERIVTLDILRGIALLGVVIANVWLLFSGAWFNFPGVLDEFRVLSLDSVVFNGIGLFVSGKAISTFSFLFGLGFAIQMLRAEARGVEIAPVYRRRLLVLLLFGIAHAVFLWYGDILTLYALFGFVLLAFRKRADRTLLVWAAVLMVAVPLALSSTPLTPSLAGGEGPAAGAEGGPMAELRATALAAFQSGRPSEVVAANLRMLGNWYLSPKVLGMLTTLGLFLIGLYAGRKGFFVNMAEHREGFRRVAKWGLGVGFVFSAALVTVWVRVPFEAMGENPYLPVLTTVFHVLGTFPLAFGYIAAVTLLVERPAWKRGLGTFAPVGRMALTNYLSQTVICLLVFYGYGGGLVGEVSPAPAFLIALLVFGAQMLWSPWWLARFRFGPAEWLWRSLTYRQLQPMRIGEPVPVAVEPRITG